MSKPLDEEYIFTINEVLCIVKESRCEIFNAGNTLFTVGSIPKTFNLGLPLVRCKNCVYFVDEDRVSCINRMCGITSMEVCYDDFCSMGIRKEVDDDSDVQGL